MSQCCILPDDFYYVHAGQRELGTTAKVSSESFYADADDLLKHGWHLSYQDDSSPVV